MHPLQADWVGAPGAAVHDVSERVRLGSLLADIGRDAGGVDIEDMRDRTPRTARPRVIVLDTNVVA